MIRFLTAAAWHAALGGVPLERVRLDPAPGTATAEDALVASEQKPLVELVHGTLVEKAMGVRESQIAAALIFLLSSHVRPRRLGAVFGADATFRMPGGNVRLPDVSYVQESRLPQKLMRVTPLCPDLVIEVLSRGNTKEEIDQKRSELFAGGTRLMWIIDAGSATAVIYTQPNEPDEAITIGGELDGGNVLPGFRIALAEVFEGVHGQG
ncbi:hypothetical protein PSMK_30600 [Phycisphaera mikurensis NBRC 102666]|uniref:Putative restriction endonuclease domain-containing protein n=1 Tax=Phycisphaera mikurensis (strain NBRC 102666 / KCTC 22515 / FYK2301M01) TaxID=1142394 RepID=I0IIY1_PHYMF|nr:hypothetical protein PSMK_30600 [Phycisphaera mikurensis NBRC 102666]